jgi:hypothetical protein
MSSKENNFKNNSLNNKFLNLFFDLTHAFIMKSDFQLEIKQILSKCIRYISGAN